VSKQSETAPLAERVAEAAADFGSAADAVDAAACDTLGINRTDLTILGAVMRAGRASAGAAAAAASLSAAATSTAIQRLVAAGLLTREADPDDRRRAVLTATPDARRWIEEVYAPIATEGRRMLDRFAPEELAVVEEFLRLGIEHQRRHARRIRELAGRVGG